MGLVILEILSKYAKYNLNELQNFFLFDNLFSNYSNFLEALKTVVVESQSVKVAFKEIFLVSKVNVLANGGL